ncbi:hypothetical protein Afe04nite_53340 [Asanoa ferruginea]|nr:hypothetical protein Afe04nite_53340 [Asanoa ferruginea]
MTRRRRFLASALAATALVLAPSAVAQAAPKPKPAVVYDWENATVPPTKAQRQAGIDDVLKRMPGSKQLDASTIQIAPGLRMKLPAAQGEVTTLAAGCNFLYLCVWSNRQYGGNRLDFYDCNKDWKLYNVAYPGGGNWADKISSISNEQTSGTWSYFYNWSGTKWNRIISLSAPNDLSNLALDPGQDGSANANDKIDGVHVCGPASNPWLPNWP